MINSVTNPYKRTLSEQQHEFAPIHKKRKLNHMINHDPTLDHRMRRRSENQDSYSNSHLMEKLNRYHQISLNLLQQNPNDPNILSNIGEIYFKKGNVALALRHYNFILNCLDSNHRITRERRIILYLKTNQLDFAKRDLDCFIKVNPKDAYALTMRGAIYEKENKLDQALADLNFSLLIYPNQFLSWDLRGTINMKMDRLIDALDDFDQALKIRPKSFATLMKRGRIYFSLDSLVKAARDFDEVIKIHQIHPQAYIFKSLVLCRLGKLEEALNAINNAIHLNSLDAFALTARGNILKALGESSLAQGDFQKALERNANHSYTKISLVRLLLEQQKFKNALKLLKSLKEGYPLAAILFLRSEAYYGLGKIEKARIYLDRACQINLSNSSYQVKGFELTESDLNEWLQMTNDSTSSNHLV